MDLAAFVKPYLVRHPGSLRLSQIKPHDTGGLDIQKKEANDLLKEGIEQLSELQERLYADNRWSILLIFQAMDAAGKDSAIKHVMSGVDPQGCEVHSFKQPSTEELDHDFLWRAARRPPERGRIFNRSYYEGGLVPQAVSSSLGAASTEGGAAAALLACLDLCKGLPSGVQNCV